MHRLFFNSYKINIVVSVMQYAVPIKICFTLTEDVSLEILISRSKFGRIMSKEHESQMSDKLPISLTNDKIHMPLCCSSNGFFLNEIYLSEEIITLILSFVEVNWLLTCSLVCRRWNYVIKSFPLWSLLYERTYKRKAKVLPWYLYYCLFCTNYFDNNLLLNGNGQLGLNFWQIKIWDGDDYIENVPVCADVLPEDVPEFNGCKSCFVTSYFSSHKYQIIEFKKNNLFRFILDNYKPHIYLSEWVSGRRDCSCVYKLLCGFIGEGGKSLTDSKPFANYYKRQWAAGKWEKMDLVITDYPSGLEAVTFENDGRNTQSWKGHFGVKMAGGVIKFEFNSIERLAVDDDGNLIPKQYEGIRFFANGISQENVIDYFQVDSIWNDNNDECYYFMP